MKKNDLLGVLAIGILVLGMGIGLILVKQSQEIREKAAPVSDILVSVSPVSYTLTKDQKTTISIVLTNRTSPAKDVSLYSSEVDLQFDSTFYSVSNITCNSGFLSSVAVSNVTGSKISIACFAPGGSGTKTIASGGEATLGSFDITALDKTGTSDITITRANVPDAVTFADLSGGTGLGGSFTNSGVGGGTPQPTANQTNPPATQNSTNPPNNNTVNPTAQPTKTPTPKPIVYIMPKTTASPSATPTPQVTLITPTPNVTTPVPTPQTILGKITSSNILLLGGIGAIILSFLVALILAFRKRSGPPPQITPPTQSSQSIEQIPPQEPVVQEPQVQEPAVPQEQVQEPSTEVPLNPEQTGNPPTQPPNLMPPQ